MKLSAYIKKLGTKAFAERHGISVRAAVAYRQGTRTPRPSVVQKLIESGAPISWRTVYAPGASGAAAGAAGAEHKTNTRTHTRKHTAPHASSSSTDPAAKSPPSDTD